jgi:hypothetical protein
MKIFIAALIATAFVLTPLASPEVPVGWCSAQELPITPDGPGPCT